MLNLATASKLRRKSYFIGSGGAFLDRFVPWATAFGGQAEKFLTNCEARAR